jgi:lipoate-protein ligase A
VLFDLLVQLDDPEPHSAALNMAIDEALLRTAEVPLLRCYRWEWPAVSFGYFGRFAEVEAAWPGRDAVRRWTGGGIVPHGDDFTYSLIVPRRIPVADLAPGESYRAIHAALARILPAPGLVLAGAPRAKVSNACFENPVRHDLVAGAEKIAGAAQRRTRHGLLHQGSVQHGSLPATFPETLAQTLATQVERRALTRVALELAARLAAEKYATANWLRRA